MMRGEGVVVCACVCVCFYDLLLHVDLSVCCRFCASWVCVCVSEVKSTLDWLVVCGQILYLLVCIGT